MKDLIDSASEDAADSIRDFIDAIRDDERSKEGMSVLFSELPAFCDAPLKRHRSQDAHRAPPLLLY